MKVIQLILVIMFLAGCSAKNQEQLDLQKNEITLYNEWLYALEVHGIKNNGEVISRPMGAEQLVMKLTLPEIGGQSLKLHCLYYRIPFKKILGLLKIQEIKNVTECPETSVGPSFLEIKNVNNLSLLLSEYKLTLNFLINQKSVKWIFSLPNIDDGVLHEKYQPQKEKRLYSGLRVVRFTDESLELNNSSYIGRLSDRMSKGTSIRCKQVSKDCEVIGEDRCEKCRYGWFQVVDYNCPQGGSRFCGQNHCGEKNEPACPRGSKVVADDEMGICQSDLTPVFNADHILICQ